MIQGISKSSPKTILPPPAGRRTRNTIWIAQRQTRWQIWTCKESDNRGHHQRQPYHHLLADEHEHNLDRSTSNQVGTFGPAKIRQSGPSPKTTLPPPAGRRMRTHLGSLKVRPSGRNGSTKIRHSSLSPKRILPPMNGGTGSGSVGGDMTRKPMGSLANIPPRLARVQRIDLTSHQTQGHHVFSIGKIPVKLPAMRSFKASP